MATEVTLPALGESVTEGTVTRWLKQVGDEVAVDEALLEVSTDKVDTEIPSPVAGTLLEIKAAEDETVEVGGLLAVIGAKDESGGGGGGDDGDGGADEAPADESAEEPEAPAEQHDEPAAESNQGTVQTAEDGESTDDAESADDSGSSDQSESQDQGESQDSGSAAAAVAAVRRSRCPRWASRSPRAR